MAQQPEDCVPGRKRDVGMAQETEECVPGRKRDARMSQQSEEWVPGWQRDAGVKVTPTVDEKRLKELKEKDLELIRLIEENRKLKDLCDIKSSLLKQTEEFWNQRERALEQTINILQEEKNQRAALEIENEDHRDMWKKLETEVYECHFKMEEMQNANKTLQTKLDLSEQAVNEFKYKLDKSNKVCRANVDMYEAKLKAMEDHCGALSKEKDDLRNRSSKLAGHMLTDKNAEIAYCSDENRPLKISEKVGTLYDDEWTDAFQELTEQLKMQRQDTIKFLLDCLEDCLKICEKVAEEQFDSLKNVILFPIQDTNYVPESKGRLGSKDEQALRDLRRKIGAKHGASVKQSFFMTLNKNKANEKIIRLVKPYLEKLADVCWLMTICDPPMYMDMTVKRGSKFDCNFYTPHTSSGKTVEYLVWPPLYNCKTGGGLISKGVVATERVVSKK